MSSGIDDHRPVFLNPLRVHLPVAGVLSIGHRLAGVFLFLLTPFAIYLLDLSLRGPAGFAEARAWLGQGLVKGLLVLGAWALSHHLFAGIRFLLIDLDLGVNKAVMRRSAWVVNLAGGLVMLLAVAVVLS